MALVTRYFGVTAAGAGDGTSWADRAPFVDGSNILSTIISGFGGFSFGDSLVCMIGPGSYDLDSSLGNAQFSVAPTVARPCIFHGCDDNGVPLEPNGWVSAQPCNWESDLPVITLLPTNANYSGTALIFRFLKLKEANTNGVLGNNPGQVSWCVIEHATTNGSAVGINIGGNTNINDSVVRMLGDAYNYCIGMAAGTTAYNCRLEGNIEANTGFRAGGYGTTQNGSGREFVRCTSFGHPGIGFSFNQTGGINYSHIMNCVSANNEGDGYALAPAATQSQITTLYGSIAVNNGGYGVDVRGGGNNLISGGRFRDNTSGNFNGMGNWPVDLNILTAGTDADEFVDAAGGDFRIKNTSDLWGRGIGAGDEPAAGGGGGSPVTRGYAI
jgi:hypothetical protein